MAEMWYYTTEGKQMDPVSMKELKRLVGDGTLKPTDMVWREGMARWIRASSVKELFPDPIAALDHYFSSMPKAEKEGAATAVTPSTTAANANAGAAPASTSGKKGAPTAAAEDEAPRKKRKPSGNDDDGDTRKPPRRRAEAAGGGSSVGIIIAVVIGLGLLLVTCGGGLAIIIWVAPGGPGKAEPIVGRKDYDAFVGPNATDSRVFTFQRGVDYELTVKSQPREPDVDLFVISVASGQTVASDIAPGPDCHIQRWTPNETGDFRVEVKNLHQFLRVTSKVTVREIAGQGPPPPPPDKDKKNPPKDGLAPLPPDVLEGRGSKDITPAIPAGQEREFKFRVRAGHRANIRVDPSAKGPNIDFNLIVSRDGGDNAQIASDERPDAKASVDVTLQNTEIVRVRVINASKGPGTNSKAKLYYDVSP
jgi:GYF domain 2